jgi:RNA polymerase sigma factor (sigma-70 family)
MSLDSDALVLRRDIWAQVCEKNYPQLLSYARWLTRNPDQAPGIVHVAVCKVLKLAPPPEAIEDKRSYLVKAVRNAWFDKLKKGRNAPTISLDDPESQGELRYQLTAPDRDPESDLCFRLDTENYRRAIRLEFRRLNEREKCLLKLHLQGYSCEEIATMLEEDVRLTRSDLNAVIAKVRYRLTKAKAKTASGRQ